MVTDTGSYKTSMMGSQKPLKDLFSLELLEYNLVTMRMGTKQRDISNDPQTYRLSVSSSTKQPFPTPQKFIPAVVGLTLTKICIGCVGRTKSSSSFSSQ